MLEKFKIKIYDSHVHVGEMQKIKDIVQNSIYKNRYRLYSSVDYRVVSEIDNYLDNVEGYFAMPIVFKEISIKEENKFLHEYCKRHSNALEVPLIDSYNNCDIIDNSIYKEHFALHDYRALQSREKYYSFLNKINGFLILHCKDSVRIEYINAIVKKYPKINIIIAHLGRDVYENFSFCKNVIDAFYGFENIFFDISTITNEDLIKYALNRCGSTKILFGTDFPYEKNCGQTIYDYCNMIMDLKISLKDKEKIFFENADSIKKYCKSIK